jgi:hypothetical protein
MYQLLENGMILQVASKLTIPPDAGNRDYQAFLEWQAEGNTPEPMPEQIVSSERDWRAFRRQIFLSPVYLKVAAASLQNTVLNSTLVYLLGRLESEPSVIPEVQQTWEMMVSATSLTSAEVKALRTMAALVGFSVDSKGNLTL